LIKNEFKAKKNKAFAAGLAGEHPPTCLFYKIKKAGELK